jgi:hypothetical protein
LREDRLFRLGVQQADKFPLGEFMTEDMGPSEPRITLLLTATVHPRSTVFVQRSDPMARLTDYRIALNRWLAEPAVGKIIFCENSGAALDQFYTDVESENAHNQEVRFVSYTAPEADGARGKGYGELGILSHVLSSQIFGVSDRILKVTGRYAIDNFEKILADIRRFRNADIITSAWHLHKLIPSECFYAAVAFLERYMLGKRELIDDVGGFFFEHALAQAVTEAVQNGAVHFEFTDQPRLAGMSGTTNLPRSMRRNSAGVELALTPDYLIFFRITLAEFSQRIENGVEDIWQREAHGLLAKVAAYTSAKSPPALTNIVFTFDELRVLQASIEVCLRKPIGFAERMGFSIEAATLLARAIEQVL